MAEAAKIPDQAEAAAEAEYKLLHPESQKLVQDVLSHHPDLTLAEALAHLKEAAAI